MKILIVEDELEIANFLSRGLKYQRYNADEAHNGEEALKMLREKEYDIIVLDLILPKLSGREILREIRMQKNNTPVIVLTAVDNTESKIEILNLGADDYMVKPFSFAELNARIRSVLRRTRGDEMFKQEEIVVGDLRLIPGSRTVMRKKKEIKLRLKEYSLLEYFARNANRVVSRSDLIENIWDYNARLFSNTVDSHISILRKKLNDGFKEQLIETVHGLGYILKVKR